MASTMNFGLKSRLFSGEFYREIFGGENARPIDDMAAFRAHVDSEHANSLSSLIEAEIIPRLMVAHAFDRPPVARPAAIDPGATVTATEIDEFAPLALQVEADALLSYVEAIMARGVAMDVLMVDLIAPAARRLGEFWADDRCDFVDVTMGLWRLQEVVHEVAAREPGELSSKSGGYRALFASMPGDQHYLGTIVIDELFSREGWLTDRITGKETSDILRRVTDSWFDMVGLTINCDCNIENLTSIIIAIRSVSRNSRVCIMLGGGLLSANPELAVKSGADGTARDAKLALKVALELVREREWSLGAK